MTETNLRQHHCHCHKMCGLVMTNNPVTKWSRHAWYVELPLVRWSHSWTSVYTWMTKLCQVFWSKTTKAFVQQSCPFVSHLLPNQYLKVSVMCSILRKPVISLDTIRYDTIEEFNVASQHCTHNEVVEANYLQCHITVHYSSQGGSWWRRGRVTWPPLMWVTAESPAVTQLK